MLTSRRALIVDPDEVKRGWLLRALGAQGWSPTFASVGAEALWLLASDPYDLVIAGARLPDVGGAQLLAMARTAGLQTPFVLILPLFSPERARATATVKRCSRAELVDDWPAPGALRAAAARLGAQPAEGISKPRAVLRQRLANAARQIALKLITPI